MGNRKYTRIFKDQDKVDLTVKLLNDGFSFSFIGNLLECHRSSVYSFKKRKVKEGVVFKKVGNKLDIIYNRFHKACKSKKLKSNYLADFERAFDKGKTYKEYVEESRKRDIGKVKSVASRMRQARQNLKEARIREKQELINNK